MAIIDRLIGLEKPKLEVHSFSAALVEYKRGYITGSQIITEFELSPTEATQLNTWLTNLDLDTISRDEIEDVLILGEASHYPRAFVVSRLSL